MARSSNERLDNQKPHDLSFLCFFSFSYFFETKRVCVCESVYQLQLKTMAATILLAFHLKPKKRARTTERRRRKRTTREGSQRNLWEDAEDRGRERKPRCVWKR